MNKVSGVEYVQEYVEMFFAGTLFPETQVRCISAGDRMTNKPGEIPNTCYGYRYFSRVNTELDNGKIHHGESYDHSPMYFFGTVYTYEQVQQFDGDYDILLSNMKNNRKDRVVKTRVGNFQLLEPNDTVYKV